MLTPPSPQSLPHPPPPQADHVDDPVVDPRALGQGHVGDPQAGDPGAGARYRRHWARRRLLGLRQPRRQHTRRMDTTTVVGSHVFSPSLSLCLVWHAGNNQSKTRVAVRKLTWWLAKTTAIQTPATPTLQPFTPRITVVCRPVCSRGGVFVVTPLTWLTVTAVLHFHSA